VRPGGGGDGGGSRRGAEERRQGAGARGGAGRGADAVEGWILHFRGFESLNDWVEIGPSQPGVEFAAERQTRSRGTDWDPQRVDDGVEGFGEANHERASGTGWTFGIRTSWFSLSCLGRTIPWAARAGPGGTARGPEGRFGAGGLLPQGAPPPPSPEGCSHCRVGDSGDATRTPEGSTSIPIEGAHEMGWGGHRPPESISSFSGRCCLSSVSPRGGRGGGVVLPQGTGGAARARPPGRVGERMGATGASTENSRRHTPPREERRTIKEALTLVLF